MIRPAERACSANPREASDVAEVYRFRMKLVLEIPELAAVQLEQAGVDVASTAMQGLALLGYRRRALSAGAIAALLGSDSRWDAWNFLREEKEPDNMTAEDWEQEKLDLEKMRVKREQGAVVGQ